MNLTGIFHYKPTNLGYPHKWKHPYDVVRSYSEGYFLKWSPETARTIDVNTTLVCFGMILGYPCFKSVGEASPFKRGRHLRKLGKILGILQSRQAWRVQGSSSRGLLQWPRGLCVVYTQKPQVNMWWISTHSQSIMQARMDMVPMPGSIPCSWSTANLDQIWTWNIARSLSLSLSGNVYFAIGQSSNVQMNVWHVLGVSLSLALWEVLKIPLFKIFPVHGWFQSPMIVLDSRTRYDQYLLYECMTPKIINPPSFVKRIHILFNSVLWIARLIDTQKSIGWFRES